MTWLEEVLTTLPTLAFVLAALAATTLIESCLPGHARERARTTKRRVSNLILTIVTLALNLFASASLALVLARQESLGHGLLRAVAIPAGLELLLALVVLDFSFYVAHVAMHAFPAFWRFHRVHHADPYVDATTTFRQHPGETVIRFAFTTAFATALGASPAAYAIYRGAVAFSALLEHADIRIPYRLDALLSTVTTWPGFHKIHHSRDPRLTDSNFGNLLSLWDWLFATRTPVAHTMPIDYGLAGLDGSGSQSIASLWRLPFRTAPRSASTLEPPTGPRELSMR